MGRTSLKPDEPASRGSRRPRGRLSQAHIERLDEIKAVSAALFAEQSYAATDVRQIADALDIHASSLYNYIFSKEHLLFEIMSDGMKEITARVDDALKSSTDVEVQLHAALKAHVLHHARRRHLAWTCNVESRVLTGDYLKAVQRLRRRYENRWLDVLKRGMDEGVFRRSEPKIVLFGLLAIGQAVSRWYDPDGDLSADEIAEILAQSALLGVTAKA